MERLTGRTRNFDGTGFALESLTSDGRANLSNFVDKVLTKLADYADAEEQGVLLRLPCKVGDVVYYINFCQGKVEEDTVMEFSLDTFDWYVRLRHSKWVHSDVFKINFYLTKEEAEQKLASMQEGE